MNAGMSGRASKHAVTSTFLSTRARALLPLLCHFHFATPHLQKIKRLWTAWWLCLTALHPGQNVPVSQPSRANNAIITKNVMAFFFLPNMLSSGNPRVWIALSQSITYQIVTGRRNLWPKCSVCFGLGFYSGINYEEQKQVPSFVFTTCLMDLSKMEIEDDHLH